LLLQQKTPFCSRRLSSAAAGPLLQQKAFFCRRRCFSARNELRLLDEASFAAPAVHPPSAKFLLQQKILVCSRRSSSAAEDPLLRQQTFFCSRRLRKGRVSDGESPENVQREAETRRQGVAEIFPLGFCDFCSFWLDIDKKSYSKILNLLKIYPPERTKIAETERENLGDSLRTGFGFAPSVPVAFAHSPP
jgi:hypothetical protein